MADQGFMSFEKIDFKKSVEALKSKLTLRQVMEYYGVTLTGKKLIRCPFHEDSTASMQVSDTDSGEGFFYCHACTDKHGDLINFVAFEEGCSLGEAISILAKRYSVDVTTRIYSNNLADTLGSILDSDGSSESSRRTSKIAEQLEANRIAQQIVSDYKQHQHLTPYMINKQIQHFGTFNKGTALVIPLTDLEGVIWGVQYIYPDGGKSFQKNCRIEGSFFRLGEEPTDMAFLVEGYATGASVYMASEIPTYVCFTAKNINIIHDILKAEMPNIEFIVAGDNDKAGRRNGLKAVYPPKGMDWNDLWCKEGREAVANFLSKENISKHVENPLVSNLENILNEGS